MSPGLAIRPRPVALALLLLCCLLLTEGVARAAPKKIQTLAEAHRVTLEIRAEIAVLCKEMGKPKVAPLGIRVRNVPLEQLWVQTQTLHEKVSGLVFEQLRQRLPALPDPGDKLDLAQIGSGARRSLEALRAVRSHIGVAETPAALRTAEEKASAAMVFESMMSANRQLNELLDRPWSPSRVFQRVTMAVSYASELLVAFPGATRIPRAPSLERRKRPADVFRRLIHCTELARAAMRASGVSTLELDARKLDEDKVRPSDVFDIASLLAANLRLLHGKMTSEPLKHLAYAPGRKFPSHVYQRAGILEAQLEQLKQRAEADGGWLERKR